MNGPLEVLHVERLPVILLDEARADLLAGGKSLREFAWGIIAYKEGKTPADVILRRTKFRYYRPPWGVYMEARLCLRAPYRGSPTPLTESNIRDGCAQLARWRVLALRLPTIRAVQ